jgi:hypothetical protein
MAEVLARGVPETGRELREDVWPRGTVRLMMLPLRADDLEWYFVVLLEGQGRVASEEVRLEEGGKEGEIAAGFRLSGSRKPDWRNCANSEYTESAFTNSGRSANGNSFASPWITCFCAEAGHLSALKMASNQQLPSVSVSSTSTVVVEVWGSELATLLRKDDLHLSSSAGGPRFLSRTFCWQAATAGAIEGSEASVSM